MEHNYFFFSWIHAAISKSKQTLVDICILFVFLKILHSLHSFSLLFKKTYTFLHTYVCMYIILHTYEPTPPSLLSIVVLLISTQHRRTETKKNTHMHITKVHLLSLNSCILRPKIYSLFLIFHLSAFRFSFIFIFNCFLSLWYVHTYVCRTLPHLISFIVALFSFWHFSVFLFFSSYMCSDFFPSIFVSTYQCASASDDG